MEDNLEDLDALVTGSIRTTYIDMDEDGYPITEPEERDATANS